MLLCVFTVLAWWNSVLLTVLWRATKFVFVRCHLSTQDSCTLVRACGQSCSRFTWRPHSHSLPWQWGMASILGLVDLTGYDFMATQHLVHSISPVLLNILPSIGRICCLYQVFQVLQRKTYFVSSLYRKRVGQWAWLKNQELGAYFLTISLNNCNKILLLNAKTSSFHLSQYGT